MRSEGAVGQEPFERQAALQRLLERARRAVDTAKAAQDRQPARDRLAALVEQLECASAEVSGLQTALRSRAVIEQAKGVLIVLRRCDADEAFASLVRMSQESHLKLHELARRMVQAAATGALIEGGFGAQAAIR